jgi:2-isopropylmalate synthase
MTTQKPRISLYDTTLRDGCQGEDVSLTLADKLRIAERLDELGFDYVEGGWPGSNPRDEEFFREVAKLRLRHARITAFGMTRRAGTSAAKDANIQKLRAAETPVITIFGKTWQLHVLEDLRISREENLDVIHDSVAYLHKHTGEVIFDAEHFFDGYRDDPGYAIDCLKAAASGGASTLVLCDTNGGNLRRSWRRRPARSSRQSVSPSASIVTTIASSPSRTRSPQSRRAPFRCKVRSTGSASAAAMRT